MFALVGCGQLQTKALPTSTPTATLTATLPPTNTPTATATSTPDVAATAQALGFEVEEVIQEGEGMVYKLDGVTVGVIDAEGKSHPLTNGFEVRENGEIWEWKAGEFAKLQPPKEVTDLLLGEPESNIDRRARKILEGMTVTMAKGRPVFQLALPEGNLTIGEYKEGKWQIADFFVAADEALLKSEQDYFKQHPAGLKSTLGLDEEHDITLYEVLGIGFYEKQLYVLAMYGDGSKWLVVKPTDLGYVWKDESHTK